MTSLDKHQFTLTRVTAAQALSFLEATESIGMNHVWHMSRPLLEKNTHIVNVELIGSLEEARVKIASIATASGLSIDWALRPAKI